MADLNNTEQLDKTEDIQTPALTDEVSVESTSKKKKNPYFKYILSIGFMVALIVVTAIILFSKYSFSDLMSVIGEVNPWWIVLGVARTFSVNWPPSS